MADGSICHVGYCRDAIASQLRAPQYQQPPRDCCQPNGSHWKAGYAFPICRFADSMNLAVYVVTCSLARFVGSMRSCYDAVIY